MNSRNLIILFFCQLISSTGQLVVVTLGGIIGSNLTDNQSIATLPVSLMVVVTALSAIPATVLMRKIGRKYGSSIASISASVAILIAVYALHTHSFYLFVISAAMFGINTAFSQQYRYAAAESVDQKFVGRSISLILLGAIGGAMLGPELVTRGQFLIEGIQYGGTLISISVLFVLQSLLLILLGPFRMKDDETTNKPTRPLVEIVKQRTFIMAMCGATVAYGSMTFIMTATPLSMHVIDGFSIEATANVIRSHVLAMYIPSLVSGFLIEKFGLNKVMACGVIGLLGATVAGLTGQTIFTYWLALVLLGIGWNFLYVGGTTMLTYTYKPNERFKAQGINEFCVFGMSALGSLLAGTIMYLYGWYTLVLIPIPFLIMVAVGLKVTNKEVKSLVISRDG
ncbi:MAG TPA: MFS transporter [Woeseiaceae bacterium]|nr:MFS transporter [Woeseiaceae bacterium]|tara:strand:- start:13981 stop:15171 length:1191 start_codon:yes stop_codon:yes gene_type:complete